MVTTIGSREFPTYVVPEVDVPLLSHQVALEQRWESIRTFLLTAGTGCGKTLAAFLPALRRGESVIAAYPTNALLRDQAEAIAALAALAGKQSAVLRFDEGPVNVDGCEVEIIPVDGRGLEAARSATGVKRKGEVLDALLTVSNRPKIIVTNPDVLFLLAAMCYRDSHRALTRLAGYRTIIFDEFHLYTGIELSRVLYLAYLLRSFGGQAGQGLQRLGLLSATPRGEVLSLLREIVSDLEEISTDCMTEATKAGTHTAAHRVQFAVGLSTSTTDRSDDDGEVDFVEAITSFLSARSDLLRAGRLGNGERTVPALIFLNSVVDARRLERALLASGWSEDELGSVRGLMSQGERSWHQRTVVVATAAAEVGIDFDCRLLVLEASELGSFVQRLGRAGRHAEAEVVLVGRGGAPGAAGLRSELARRPAELVRDDFLRLASSVFPTAGTHADFASAAEGVFAATSLTEHILERVTSDYGADADTRERVRQTLLGVERSYFGQWQGHRGTDEPDVSTVYSDVRRQMDRAARGKSAAHRWMKTYQGNFPSFRSQSLQVVVADREEARRGREPTYRADLRTLARWAELGPNHRFEKGLGYVVDVTRYLDRPHRYCIVLRRPDDWPEVEEWPPHGLFWIGREAHAKTRMVTATLISDSTGGRFPGSFPPSDDPVLALVVLRDELDSLGFDWRLQTWPLRRQVGSASDAAARSLVLGDNCLLAWSRLKPLQGIRGNP